MSPSIRPDAELPPPLMTSEPGSFARQTIVERKPQIIGQVMADNDYAPSIRQALEAFKDRPFFVSDAMPKDVRETLSTLRAAPDPGLRELGARLQSHLDAGRLELREDAFWTSYLMFRDLPHPLREALVRSDLVVLKGDVNYRRLLSDRHWPYTAQLRKVAAYFPAPFLVLRTLKGEIMVGLEPGQAERLAAEDPTWLINGKRGIIQLVR